MELLSRAVTTTKKMSENEVRIEKEQAVFARSLLVLIGCAQPRHEFVSAVLSGS